MAARVRNTDAVVFGIVVAAVSGNAREVSAG